MTATERIKGNAALDEIRQIFQKSGDVAQMTDAEKTAMFNSQEQVNAILAKRDNERLICKNEMPVGSHILAKTCTTAGDIEARRRQDKTYLQRTQNTSQSKNGNGSRSRITSLL